MADIVDTVTRSRMMAAIRGRNTQPERIVRSLLHRQGFRFCLNVSTFPGKPDLVLPRWKAVIFVHGCFWHGHDCHLFKWPSTRPEFWHDKIERNRERDARNRGMLEAMDWRVGTVWECALKGRLRDPGKTVDRLAVWLRESSLSMEIRGEGG